MIDNEKATIMAANFLNWILKQQDPDGLWLDTSASEDNRQLLKEKNWTTTAHVLNNLLEFDFDYEEPIIRKPLKWLFKTYGDIPIRKKLHILKTLYLLPISVSGDYRDRVIKDIDAYLEEGEKYLGFINDAEYLDLSEWDVPYNIISCLLDERNKNDFQLNSNQKETLVKLFCRTTQTHIKKGRWKAISYALSCLSLIYHQEREKLCDHFEREMTIDKRKVLVKNCLEKCVPNMPVDDCLAWIENHFVLNAYQCLAFLEYNTCTASLFQNESKLIEQIHQKAALFQDDEHSLFSYLFCDHFLRGEGTHLKKDPDSQIQDASQFYHTTNEIYVSSVGLALLLKAFSLNKHRILIKLFTKAFMTRKIPALEYLLSSESAVILHLSDIQIGKDCLWGLL